MNWHDDPILAKERYHAGVRGKLLRSTLIWGPPFLLVFGALLFFGFDRAFMGGDHGGTWFLVIVLGILSLLFGFQAIGSLRDYLSKPVRAGLVAAMLGRWVLGEAPVDAAAPAPETDLTVIES